MAAKVISENIEEYLEVLYKFGGKNTFVSTTTLSHELGIAPGSVTQMLKKLEDLGYIEYKNDKAKDYGYIIDVNTKYTPRFTIYKIDTGETISAKYSKRDYEQSELDKGKIIKFVTTEKPRKKLIDGHWVDLEESELWIKSYKIFQ